MVSKKIKYVNKYEMMVIGLQRSGNHAIIDWIISQLNGKKCFLNFVKPNSNPFLTFDKESTLEYNKDFFKGFNINKERVGDFVIKSCLIYSYEDDSFSDIFTYNFLKNRIKWIGKSLKQYHILILRDPFNLFASRLKRERLDEEISQWSKIFIKDKKGLNKIKKLWKNYAKEYLNQTSYLLKNKILINYNKWLINKDYRKKIAKEMSLKFKDYNFSRILKIGGGSSFKDVTFNDNINRRKLLERWKVFKDDKYYNNIFRDKEIIKMSNKIFGKIPGTEKLGSKI